MEKKSKRSVGIMCASCPFAVQCEYEFATEECAGVLLAETLQSRGRESKLKKKVESLSKMEKTGDVKCTDCVYLLKCGQYIHILGEGATLTSCSAGKSAKEKKRE